MRLQSRRLWRCRTGRHRVVPTRVEGVAAQQPPDRQPESPQRAVRARSPPARTRCTTGRTDSGPAAPGLSNDGTRRWEAPAHGHRRRGRCGRHGVHRVAAGRSARPARRRERRVEIVRRVVAYDRRRAAAGQRPHHQRGAGGQRRRAGRAPGAAAAAGPCCGPPRRRRPWTRRNRPGRRRHVGRPACAIGVVAVVRCTTTAAAAGATTAADRRGEVARCAAAAAPRPARYLGILAEPRLRPTGGRGPWRGAPTGWRGRHGCACAAGSRGSSRAGGCSAGRCACSRQVLRLRARCRRRLGDRRSAGRALP